MNESKRPHSFQSDYMQYKQIKLGFSLYPRGENEIDALTWSFLSQEDSLQQCAGNIWRIISH